MKLWYMVPITKAEAKREKHYYDHTTGAAILKADDVVLQKVDAYQRRCKLTENSVNNMGTH